MEDLKGNHIPSNNFKNVFMSVN